ncbi:pentapeptide repeat-containing protein [Micromonospora sp. HUAS LYJ1]|uniref:pentapeptide repeat-containing protein n=1 Tax=Micromonospora sp. HUAS LYJ1 TaxID=3061626 RepID=UPI0026712F6C|nr:pentapeptide repeat-containing protein [Micromonospora sp. HUAS LYJ1]WKU03407.1 pentapeptide repeat-containing protein [Micromonospora sp. HUAS LYJ1]
MASGGPVLVPVAVGLVALVAGVLLWQRDGAKHEVSAAPTPPDRQVRPLRSWVIPVGVVLVGVVTWAAVTWLQGSVPTVGDQVERAKVRIESIRAALTIGAAVTAAFALLLAFRRQQLAERTQQATEYDAGEKRVTELYVKAADQLGSDKAPVRLAGLYALERLAQDNPIHRQSIVEVICAYLRMPYTPPDDLPIPTPTTPPPAGDPDPTAPTAITGDSDKPAVELREERQVRLAAQRILARHLRPTTPEGDPHPLYWGPKVTLDLTEAVLIDLDLNRCYLHNTTFTKTHFTGDTRFALATFDGDAEFAGARFSGDAWFLGARFSGDATFSGVTFSGHAMFDMVTFDGAAGFHTATFNGYAQFIDAAFNGRAEFDTATFNGYAGFDRATFDGLAVFDRATFDGYAGFVRMTFSGPAWFHTATFSGDAGFGEATFSGFAGFGEATFRGDAWFAEATFSGDASFVGAAFSGDAKFDRATFSGTASFDGTTLGGVRYDGPGPTAK